ncbi:hypothetical protein DPMN_127555 [Dreissena polymorpha]|uniref:Uncharacterized protein n=1 Tax=Dreissena polymorpha TaxID=45954 RepID=A0A9D4H286_DREPO|nr:hypothetical protein DPMN_127555 [Dreissena polymorpha]
MYVCRGVGVYVGRGFDVFVGTGDGVYVGRGVGVYVCRGVGVFVGRGVDVYVGRRVLTATNNLSPEVGWFCTDLSRHAFQSRRRLAINQDQPETDGKSDKILTRVNYT